jgi:tRNA G18 (ribose-2'-O)-methylase SpoU
MTRDQYKIFQCTSQGCNLRFPGFKEELLDELCPQCGEAITEVATVKLVKETVNNFKPSHINIVAVLDNIRSAWNVGSIFRTSEGAGIRKLYLCGITPSPEHPQVSKTSLGAENQVTWSKDNNALIVVKMLKDLGYRIWGLEDLRSSENLFKVKVELSEIPIVIIVGNEMSGIDPGIIPLCDKVLSIPMMGIKKSYNVAVAFGIAASYLSFNAD